MNRRFLVVTPNVIARQFIVGELRMLDPGYEVMGATSGSEAVDFIKKELVKPDILIVEADMPTMSGFDLAQQLFVLGIRIPTMFMIEKGDQYAYTEAQHFHGKGLIKPVSMERLRMVLKTMLEELYHSSSVADSPAPPLQVLIPLQAKAV